jgi:NMD protein affecting ribosome stability and mRNA decay
MKTLHGAWQSVRHDELRDELIHDPYQSARKFAEPTRCPECGLVYREGRWTRGAVVPDAHEARCPACARIHDDFPAGYVTLTGDFFRGHRDEILRLVRHCEAKEQAEHPLQRIMQVAEEDDGVLVTTTDMHLARGIAHAVHAAYSGDLGFHYNREQCLLRADWHRA